MLTNALVESIYGMMAMVFNINWGDPYHKAHLMHPVLDSLFYVTE